MTERNGIWLKIAVVAIPLAAAGLIAWGSLRSEVSENSRTIEKKADRETVQVQYDAILRELSAIRADISDLKGNR